MIDWKVHCLVLFLPQDMSILKDYIAYARMYIHPKLSEEASHRLIQAYVGMKQYFSSMKFFVYCV